MLAARHGRVENPVDNADKVLCVTNDAVDFGERGRLSDGQVLDGKL